MKHRRPALKNKTSSSTPRSQFVVEGESSVLDYLKLNPAQVIAVYYRDRISDELAAILKQHQINAVLGGNQEFAGYAPQSPVWAVIKISLLPENELFDELEQRQNDLIVICDHITDPRNLGAVVRSCAYFGVENIIIPNRRQVQLTNVVVSTAQAGFARTHLTVVANINQMMARLKKMNYWICGTSLAGKPLEEFAEKPFAKMALIIGSEGKGMSQLVEQNCDLLIKISGAKETVDSLNVSVATGIFLHHFSLP